MPTEQLCRIGVFYDGSYFQLAQRYYRYDRDLGWLDLRSFHELIEHRFMAGEPGFSSYQVVYAGWYQGMFPSEQATEKQLRGHRDWYYKLMEAGVRPHYQPTYQAKKKEKGVDVALAVDAMLTVLEGYIDVAAIVSVDGDFVPLVRALLKQGIQVMVAHFDFDYEYDGTRYQSVINERLRAACTHELNVSSLEKQHDEESVESFRRLFR